MAKKSTLQKVTDTVLEAASSVIHAAEEHVVEPVGKALGLIKKEEQIVLKPTKLPKKAESKTTSKAAVKVAQKTLVKDIAPKGKKKAKTSKTIHPESTKQKMNIPTNSGKVPNSRPGAGRAR